MSTPTVSAAGQIRRGELTEAASSRSRTTKSEIQKALAPSKVFETIEQHVLLDGSKVVIDLDKSRGAYLHNAASENRRIDLYGFVCEIRLATRVVPTHRFFAAGIGARS